MVKSDAKLVTEFAVSCPGGDRSCAVHYAMSLALPRQALDQALDKARHRCPNWCYLMAARRKRRWCQMLKFIVPASAGCGAPVLPVTQTDVLDDWQRIHASSPAQLAYADYGRCRPAVARRKR
jgi:hypothetical protein